MFSKEDLDKVKREVSISALLAKYNVEIIRSGSSYKALCPLHSENSPSFYIKEDVNTFHCFGCGKSGDIFSFVQERDGVNFRESIISVIEMFNLDVQETNAPVNKSGVSSKDLRDALRLASEWYAARLYDKTEHAAKARGILKERGLLDLTLVEMHGIGFAPYGNVLMEELNRRRNISLKVLEEAGLVKKNDKDEYTDVFKGRLLWSIYDKYGKVVGFGGRRISDDNKKVPKYLNSPDSPVYNKSGTLWSLNHSLKEARETGEIYVVEGYTDVMALNKAGFVNAVAPCGTAFTEGQGKLISSMREKPVTSIFMFDGDEAGQKAALRIFSENLYDLRYSYVVTPQDTQGNFVDPCDLMIHDGVKAVKEAAKNKRVPLVEFVLSNEKAKYDLNSPEGRAQYVDAAVSLLNSIEKYSLRLEYVRIVASDVGWDASEVIGMLRKDSSSQEQVVASTSKGLKGINIEEQLTAAILQYPKTAWELYSKNGKEFFPDAERFKDKDTSEIYLIAMMTMPAFPGEKGVITEDDVTNPGLLNKLTVLPVTDEDSIEDGSSEMFLILESICGRVATTHKRMGGTDKGLLDALNAI